MKNLGYANGWVEAPDEVKKCRQEGHEKMVEKIGNCLKEFSCKICGYSYKVDSGG